MGCCLELLLGVLNTTSLPMLASAAALLPSPISTLLLDELRGTGVPLNRAELVCLLLVLLGAVSLCSEEMYLREGCKPQLAWKFSDGQGSKEWITLDDEGAYKCMIMAATRRIQTQVKKESDLEDLDLGHGWWIDLKVERIEEGEDEEDVMVSVKGKEKEKPKKRKKKSKKVSSRK